MNTQKKKNGSSITDSYPEFNTMMTLFSPDELAEIVKEIKESGNFTEEELNLICGSNKIAAKVLKS